jgi:hypothetical protein
MSETIGYTLSALVAGVVLLVVHSTTFRAQEAVVATLQYNSVKQSTVDLVSVMAQDFRNVGSNYPYPNLLSGLAVLGYDTVNVSHHFEFSAQTVRGQVPDTVRYEWKPGNPVTTGNHTYPTVLVQRFVNGELAGRNSGSITSLSIELFAANGDPVMAAAEIRQIKVDLKMVSSLGSNGAIEESRWSETFHPMHMSKHDGISL